MAVALTPMAGMTSISLSDIFKDGYDMERDIIITIRLPRIALAFLAGSALSLGGMTFQSIFRNPLATPFTLGVASGASLGAAIALSANITFSLLGISGITLCAFLGALLAVLLVYGLSTSRSVQGSSATLLAGIAVSFFFSSLNMFVQYISDFTRLAEIVRWLMGGLTTVGWVETKSIIWPVILCSAVIFYFSRELNLLSSGDEIAISRGMNVTQVKRILFVAVSIMIGAVVATCGPIGFIGMMAPHICRLLIGADHRFLAPASLIIGGTFLTLCDTAARTIIAPAEIPVGVITALVGGPFFLWLLLRKGGTRNLF
jgi:iron complex transport system permease protein